MQEITPLILFATSVTISHAIFDLLAKKNKKNAQLLKTLWNIHYWINGTLWLIMVGWIIWFQFKAPDLVLPLIMQLLGIGIILLGTYLVIVSYKRLGLKELLGYRFFSQEKLQWTNSGIFSKLHNPMYDGFVLLLIGFGLWRGLTFDFYGALTSFVLGNLFLASIEKERTEFKLSSIF